MPVTAASATSGDGKVIPLSSKRWPMGVRVDQSLRTSPSVLSVRLENVAIGLKGGHGQQRELLLTPCGVDRVGLGVDPEAGSVVRGETGRPASTPSGPGWDRPRRPRRTDK